MNLKLAPAWMQSVVMNTLRHLDTGLHDKAITCSIAVAGEDGYQFDTGENMQELDPEATITMLMEAYAMTAAGSLAVLLAQVHTELEAATDLPTEPDERIIEMRRRTEGAIRHWLRSVMFYAGEKHQATHGTGPTVAAISQMVGMWAQVAEGKLAIVAPPRQQELERMTAIAAAFDAAGMELDAEGQIVLPIEGAGEGDDGGD